MPKSLWGQLGSIKFQLLKSPFSFNRNRSYTYPEHKLIEGKPKVQYTGSELEKVYLDIKLHEHFCTPDQEIYKIEQEANKKNPLSLTLGDGKYFGEFVIESYNIKYDHMHSNGRTMMAEVGISLKEWVGNENQRTETAQYSLVTK